MVFNPRLVASTQDSQSQQPEPLVASKHPFEALPLIIYQNTQKLPLSLGTYLLYCVANWYRTTYVIIASGGQPTEQSQSSPNQTTHVMSLRPLDLNSCHGYCLCQRCRCASLLHWATCLWGDSHPWRCIACRSIGLAIQALCCYLGLVLHNLAA